MTFFDVIINNENNDNQFLTKSIFNINSINDIYIFDLRNKMPPLNNYELLGSTANSLATLIEYDIPNYRCSRMFIYYNERINTETYNLISSIKNLMNYSFCSYEDYPYEINKINEEPPKEIYKKAQEYQYKFDIIKIKKELKSLLLSIINNEPFIISIEIYENFDENNIKIPTITDKKLGAISIIVCGFNIYKQVFIIRYLNKYLELPFIYLLKENYSSDCFIFVLRTFPILINQELKIESKNETVTEMKIIDLRPKFPEVYEQGKIGSCSANSLCSIFDYDSKNNFRGSRLFLYYNERLLINETEKDNGAYIDDGITALKTFGICHENDWKYNINNIYIKPDNNAYEKAKNNYIQEAIKIDNNINIIREWLDKNEPITVGIAIYSNFMSLLSAKTGKIGLPTEKDKFMGGHAVVICGYNDYTREFIMRNSWGVFWGDNGYFYLPYEYISNSKLTGDLWIIIKIVEGNLK